MSTRRIEELLALRYASICDKRNFSDIQDIVTEDFTQTGPEWQCDGAEAFEAQLGYLKVNFSATMHMVGNQLGAWGSDIYRGETYSIANHLYQKDGVARKLDMAIRYDEEIRQEHGVYKYARRDVHVIWVSDTALYS
ncbi:MAG: nuclear transport factor 2 family protein [Halieaceae bacterium]|nr:nuclear transport factor 2 family protein [Halieaceae bacterium]